MSESKTETQSSGYGPTIVSRKTAKALSGKRKLIKVHTPHGDYVIGNESSIRMHGLILEGAPISIVSDLVRDFEALKDPAIFQKATGMSMRTYHRKKKQDRLTPVQGERTLRFKKLYEKAKEVFQSEDKAEEWMVSPALALSGERPVDLVATEYGAEMVEDVLTRLEYGVYT